MSAAIILGLRLVTAFALYGFLGWALFVLWKDLQKQGLAISNRQIPEIRLAIHNVNAAPIEKSFSKPEITIGRDPSCDISLIDDKVSARHAQLSYRQGQWWLDDLNSTNGSSLNKISLTMPTVLVSGDEIQCGATRLIVNLQRNL